MKLFVSNSSEKPIYEQIKDQLTDQIVTEILVKLFNLPVIFAGVFTFYMASIQLFNNIWSILVIFIITSGITFGSYKLSYSIFKKKDL